MYGSLRMELKIQKHENKLNTKFLNNIVLALLHCNATACEAIQAGSPQQVGDRAWVVRLYGEIIPEL